MATFQALLYNAQLEAIHEFTSDEADGIPAKFGMKSKKGPHSKLKSRASGQNLKLKVKHLKGALAEEQIRRVFGDN